MTIIDGDVETFHWTQISGIVEIGLGKTLEFNDLGRVVGNIHHHKDVLSGGLYLLEAG